MFDPIKVIWKYKNNHRRIQYNTYIFIGKQSDDIIKILNKIHDLSLYDSWISLNKSEIKKLEELYTEFWYKKFFNMYHINYTISLIKDSVSQKKELTDKFGEAWMTKHIEQYQLIEIKLLYSYESLIKDERSRKSMKKGRTAAIIEDDADLDYTTYKKDDIHKIFEIKSKLKRLDYNSSSSENKEVTSTSTSSSENTITEGQQPLLSPFSLINLQHGGVSSCSGCKRYFTCKKCGEQFRCNNCKISKDELYEPNNSSFCKKCGKTYDEHFELPLKGGQDDDYYDETYDEEDDDYETNHGNESYEENEEENEDFEKYEDDKRDDENEFDNGINGQVVPTEPDREDEEDPNLDLQNKLKILRKDNKYESKIIDEDFNMQEIEELYKDVDVIPDEELNKTSKLLQKALNDDQLLEKKISSLIEFDTSKDNNIYDENLKDVFRKFYVTEQYVFKDDTIKTIKDKICCSIKNNSKFDKNSYLIPSRQYMWCEYFFNNKVEKVMIGQKWIRRNELLNIDVEPNNNIRFYEELRNNLKLLRDNIRRYGNKIKREDDDTNILFDYINYITNNEIYMIDVYNELGLSYNPDQETLKNLFDIYIRLYFPRIKSDDLKYIIDYLNNEKKVESQKIVTVFENINNDLILVNESMNIVENINLDEKPQYKSLFKNNYITLSIIHLNLRILEGKIDLYRIFNEFEPNDTYPFLQYQTIDGTIFFKFKEDIIQNYLKKGENVDALGKWFENSPYGISFRVKITEKKIEKFTSINLNESGRVEYKTQWKEEDLATLNDIKKTYEYVKNLLRKINHEKNKVKIDIPDDSEFKYAFINTIQKFELPNNFSINHNDLSEFARYFFPYVTVVIDPRKRQAKVLKGAEKSKFGTYLRYKRVSKYENQQRLEQRIMYFMRNYEYQVPILANEISKQFNITEEKALEEIERVRLKYPNIKKSRKFLKKLENIPKYKPPGIDVNIQGKQKDKYKIRISGARDKPQLDRIIDFMNILIYLYTETYLYKRPERQILKDRLKAITNIARRRHKVEEIVDYNKEVKTVKQMTQFDKKRIGFKPNKGQNQWTRSCQNSGNDKKRQPQQYSNVNMDALLKKGYVLNKKTGIYEKRILVRDKHKKKMKEVILKTIKVKELDDLGNPTSNDIYYACNPDDNGSHFYVGFLTRSSNPHGYCMPCCFKKDPALSKNVEKREYYQKCLEQNGTEDVSTLKLTKKTVGERLYILQDTNKIQEGRFGFLPRHLDSYFNAMLDNQKKIKNHYLVKTTTGYFFKYGTRQDEFQFLNSISSVLDLSVDEIKNKIIKTLENDKNDLLFISLNNGDIKTQYGTREKYIDFIKYSTLLDFDLLNAILSIPGVIEKYGLNIIVFQKKIIVIKRTLEKEKIKEDFNLLCQNMEDNYNLINPRRKNLFLLKENRNYYPIVKVYKENELVKNIHVEKTFLWKNEENNIVNHIKDFYQRNCYSSFLDEIIKKNTPITARETTHILNSMTLIDNKNNFKPRYQIIDIRNKCKYIITTNNLIIPVRPSGSLYDLQIVKNIDRFTHPFDDTLKLVNELYAKSNKQIPIKPKSVYFDLKNGNKYQIVAIVTKSLGVIPVTAEYINFDKLSDLKLTIENKPLYDKIDKEIAKGSGNYVIDERIRSVNYDKYYNESYELFRFEFSDYITRPNNVTLKDKVNQILTLPDKKEKSIKIKLLIYKLIDKSLYQKYKSLINVAATSLSGGKSFNYEKIYDDYNEIMDFKMIGHFDKLIFGGQDTDEEKKNKFVKIINNVPNLDKYQVLNDRNTCRSYGTQNECSKNVHCSWSHNECQFSLTTDMIITFVNKISEELATGDLKALEIMRVGNYFVSDIVDMNKFSEIPGQKIVRSSSNTIKKVLVDLFGIDNIPKIGKRRGIKAAEVNYQQMNIDNPLRDMQDYYIQNIIINNLSIFRAYVNGYYWLKHPYYNIESRNLGYYSISQTDLANYFKSLLIDYLQNKRYKSQIEKDILQYIDVKKSSEDKIHDFIIKIGTDVVTSTNCIVELYILNKIQKIPIIVYDDDNNIIYVFNDGLKQNIRNNLYMSKTELDNLLKDKKNIKLRFNFITNSVIPDEIETIYDKNSQI